MLRLRRCPRRLPHRQRASRCIVRARDRHPPCRPMPRCLLRRLSRCLSRRCPPYRLCPPYPCRYRRPPPLRQRAHVQMRLSAAHGASSAAAASLAALQVVVAVAVASRAQEATRRSHVTAIMRRRAHRRRRTPPPRRPAAAMVRRSRMSSLLDVARPPRLHPLPAAVAAVLPLSLVAAAWRCPPVEKAASRLLLRGRLRTMVRTTVGTHHHPLRSRSTSAAHRPPPMRIGGHARPLQPWERMDAAPPARPPPPSRARPPPPSFARPLAGVAPGAAARLAPRVPPRRATPRATRQPAPRQQALAVAAVAAVGPPHCVATCAKCARWRTRSARARARVGVAAWASAWRSRRQRTRRHQRSRQRSCPHPHCNIPPRLTPSHRRRRSVRGRSRCQAHRRI